MEAVLACFPEEPCGHGEADEDDDATEDGLGNQAGKPGGGVAADGAGHHGEKAVAPLDLATDHEGREWDAIGHGGGDYFEGVDLVQVLETEEGEQGDDEEAGSGAKVADIEADHDGAEEHEQASGVTRTVYQTPSTPLEPAGDGAAEGKDDGGDQQEPWDKVQERGLRSVEQDEGAGGAPKQTRYGHGYDEAHVFADVFTIGGDGGELAGPKGYCVGSVGLDGQHAGSKHSGKEQE